MHTDSPRSLRACAYLEGWKEGVMGLLIERIRRGHLQRQTPGKCTDALHTFTHGDREHTSRTRRSSPGGRKRFRRTPAGRRRGTAKAFTDWVLLDPPALPWASCVELMDALD